MAANGQRKPLEPFTVDHWVAYSSRLVLDTGAHWVVEDFQIAVIEPILRGVKEVWGILPEGNAKALSLDTPLPTPTGWTTMGEVEVGDRLLGSDGAAVRVTATSDVFLGNDCYRVTFSDGASLVADAGHLWEVEDAQDHYRPKVRSTRELYTRPVKIAKGQSEVARWRVPTVSRRCSPLTALPLDPYVLGAWLGDGHTADGRITNADQGVWNQIAAAGFEFGPWTSASAVTRTVFGLKPLLRTVGVLNNKHIPSAYLTAPIDVRRSLLEGLIDTDGTVSKAGQVGFCSTKHRLARDVQRLAWSLGHPCSIDEDRAVCNGKDCGPSFRLTISCDRRHRITRLARKQHRLKGRGLTADHRRIVSIVRVPSVATRCVKVDAEDRLFLAGEAMIPTHNSTLMAGFALYHADYTPSPWVPIGASSRDQAEIMFGQAAEIVRTTPGMLGRFRVYEGYRRIVSLRNGGRGIRVYAADKTTGDGVIPTLALLDEGHRHPDLGLYRLWKGKLNKRRGQIVMISTAGEPGGDFEETRDAIRNKATEQIRDGAHLISRGPNIEMHEWAVRNPSDITKIRAVKAANPLSTITEESLQDEFDSPTTDLGDWRRLKCNIPSRTMAAAITDTEWADALSQDYASIPAGERTDVGCDVAWKHDTFAIVPLWKAPAYRLLGKAKILTPPRDGSSMHPDEPKRAFEELMNVNPIDAVVIDMERAEDIAAWLEDEMGITVIDRPQGNANAVEDYDAFMEGLRNGTLKRVEDREMTTHVKNAIARLLPGDKKRFDRPSQSRAKRRQVQRVIDGLTAAGMVNWYADGFVESGEPLLAWR